MNRQQERKSRFEFALTQMPMWETWEEERPPRPPEPEVTETSMYGITAELAPRVEHVSRIIHHVKLIPRSVRRDMARKRAKREYCAHHGLLIP